MRPRATKAKKDEEHDETVRRLEGLGYGVVDLFAEGRGVPDLLVGMPMGACLLELKSQGSRTKSGRPRKRGKVQAKTDESQREFRDRWPGPIFVAVGADQAVAAVQWYERLLSRLQRGYLEWDFDDPCPVEIWGLAQGACGPTLRSLEQGG